jgi:acetyl esterase/lipase
MRTFNVLLLVVLCAVLSLLGGLAVVDPEIPLVSKVGGLALWLMLIASGVPHTFSRVTFESMIPVQEPGEAHGVASWDLAFAMNETDPLLTAFRLFVPLNSTEAMNVIVFIHGGGYFLVHADDVSQDSFARDLAKATHSIVLSLEYRLAPEHPFPASLEDARRFLSFAVDLTKPAPFLCRRELRQCAEDLARADRRTLLRTQHPLTLNVKRDWFAQIGSSAGANLVLGATLGKKDAAPGALRIAHTELMAPYLGVTEAEVRTRRDWILHEELLLFAAKVVGIHLKEDFMDPVANNADVGNFASVRISAGRKEIGLAAMQRLCAHFVQHETPCEMALYDAVHGFIAMGKLGGHTAYQARLDTFETINARFRQVRKL